MMLAIVSFRGNTLRLSVVRFPGSWCFLAPRYHSMGSNEAWDSWISSGTFWCPELWSLWIFSVFRSSHRRIYPNLFILWSSIHRWFVPINFGRSNVCDECWRSRRHQFRLFWVPRRSLNSWSNIQTSSSGRWCRSLSFLFDWGNQCSEAQGSFSTRKIRPTRELTFTQQKPLARWCRWDRIRTSCRPSQLFRSWESWYCRFPLQVSSNILQDRRPYLWTFRWS